MKLSDVKIGFSNLSGDVFLFVPDKKGLAKTKKPCEHELIVKHPVQALDTD
jgi:hypothetical protein